MPRIYVLSGSHDVGRTFDVQSGATFGRSAECAVALHDASVSRRHARLERDGDEWRVIDEGSRNGLFVNDVRVELARLGDNDEFRLGEVLMRFRTSVQVAPPEKSAPNKDVDQPLRSAPPERAAEVAHVAPEITFTSAQSDEIELEGTWEAPTRAPVVSAPGSTPANVPRERPTAAADRARKLAAAGLAPVQARTDTRGVLQFNRVDQREGLFASDLAQQPLWLKFALGLVAIALCALIAWLAFRGTTLVKERLSSPETVDDPKAH